MAPSAFLLPRISSGHTPQPTAAGSAVGPALSALGLLVMLRAAQTIIAERARLREEVTADEEDLTLSLQVIVQVIIACLMLLLGAVRLLGPFQLIYGDSVNKPSWDAEHWPVRFRLLGGSRSQWGGALLSQALPQAPPVQPT
eukprot:GHVT01077766.1.p2 GENE.GHVT01077766.1~~GHVT01077766.1.p2  ORF type:complete len:142 (+),score=37.95 GHVT01077766.1:416-841(+)